MRSTLESDEVLFYERAGHIIKKARAAIKPSIKEGVRLLDVAERVERFILDEGAKLPFPCTIAINHVASHYTPSRDDERAFKKGDVVKLDFGACVKGYIADAAFTVEVGTSEHAGLIEAAEMALSAGVGSIRPGVRVSEVGRAMEMAASSKGFRTLKDLLGHSLGRYRLHGGLTIPAYDDGSDMKIREGDVLAIEPFLTEGSGAVVRQDRGNIYQLIRNGEIYVHGHEERELLAYIWKRFGSFPFAERWLPRPDRLQELVRAACVKSIPIMVEADGAPVAQAEGTVIVERDGCRIIT
ncbi:type II methionyl aminopeptidase [Methanocella conradii]|uniref:type II methionyl aminopeptidase n=1 Tax=Methanocella conradii TaxID=1175444 RepID=UPI00157DF2C8|nr:type II methionyl aminopeptidase [Methanocella conradii]